MYMGWKLLHKQKVICHSTFVIPVGSFYIPFICDKGLPAFLKIFFFYLLHLSSLVFTPDMRYTQGD